MGKKDRIRKVKTNSISEIRNAVNYLIEIFNNEGDEKEIHKLVVKNGKLEITYDDNS